MFLCLGGNQANFTFASLQARAMPWIENKCIRTFLIFASCIRALTNTASVGNTLYSDVFTPARSQVTSVGLRLPSSAQLRAAGGVCSLYYTLYILIYVSYRDAMAQENKR